MPYCSFAARYILCQRVRFLPDCIFSPAKSSFSNYPALFPSLLIHGNLFISPSVKTQLHAALTIPQPRLESKFPHQQHDGLHMPRMPKLIHNRHFLHAISFSPQHLQIPCQSPRIAAHIHNSFRPHLHHSIKQSLITPLPRRINHDHIRINPILCIFFRQNFFCFPHKEPDIIHMVHPSI